MVPARPWLVNCLQRRQSYICLETLKQCIVGDCTERTFVFEMLQSIVTQQDDINISNNHIHVTSDVIDSSDVINSVTHSQQVRVVFCLKCLCPYTIRRLLVIKSISQKMSNILNVFFP